MFSERENVRLHNLLICSILKNACNVKVPPPPVTSHDSQQSGDVLLSPQKATVASTRHNANVNSASHESTITNDIVVSENGDLTSRDTWKPVQHHQEVLGKTDNRRDVLLPDPEKLPSTKGPVGAFLSGRDQSEVLVVEDGKESCARSSLQAPLGIPLFSGSISGTQRALPSARSARYAKSCDIGGLLDSEGMHATNCCIGGPWRCVSGLCQYIEQWIGCLPKEVK